MKSIFKSVLFHGIGAALATSTAMGAFTFNNGDLILGFQATGGAGSGKNVFVNLGSGVYHRDNAGNLGSPTSGNNPFGGGSNTQIADISATLVLAYGENWFDRSDVYFGIIGNLSSKPNTGIGSAGQVNGDPSRTVYVSRDTQTIGGALAWTGVTSSALGTAGGDVTGLEGILPGLTTQADGAAILDQATQAVAWNNGWTAYNPMSPPGAFHTFGGGIQQNFGESDDVTYIDLQRILSTTTGATPSGTVGTGSYETTFAIGRDGSITAVPEASTSFLGLAAVSILAFRRRRTQIA
jgi:hypothetical protein